MQDTRQRIIDAAVAIFNEDYSAPLERVAERAGITRRTLHRLFSDRDELMSFCERDMQRRCQQAMRLAFESSKEPMEQLERMLYAGIDCGAKYSFFYKLHMRDGHVHNKYEEDCAAFDEMYARYRQVVSLLQGEGRISQAMTIEWVFMLFSSIITTTVNANSTGTVAPAHIKKFAWYSFIKGIGG